MAWLVDTIRDILLPPFCACCRHFLDDRTPLCATCRERIKPIVSTTISLTSTKDLPVFALAAYEEPLRILILAKNYRNRTVSLQLAELMLDYLPDTLFERDIIIPVPLHWTRYAWRGFNQAEVIARALAQKKNLVYCDALKRTRRTAFQSVLSSEERKENVEHVFSLIASPDILSGKHLLLVDDLMTTGATLRQAARALLSANPASITAIVACRVL